MVGESPLPQNALISRVVPSRTAAENPDETAAPPLLSSSSRDPRRRRFESVKGLFVDIFSRATVSSVDPLRCISIGNLRSREILRYAVTRLKNSISGTSVGESLAKGFIATGKFGVVAKIPESFAHLTEEHFRERGASVTEAKKMSHDRPLYHVIDGGHVHQALVELVLDCSETFGGFRWPVVVIEWQSPDTLLAISRMCHEMQQDEHKVEFPVPDVMFNLRTVIDTHSRRNGIAVVPGQKLKNGFVNEIVALYTGGQGFSSSTLKSLCYVVVRLSSSVVFEMKKLLTEECEDYCRQLGEKRPFSSDSRPYKKLISTQSFKGARFFLNHKEFSDEDRIHVIHRLRFISREKESFRAFQASQIDEQSRRVVAAQLKIRAFQEFLGGNSWPTEMESLRMNMLRTTLMDDEVEVESEGDSLLPLLTQAYVKATGTHGSQRLSQYKRMKDLSEPGRGGRSSAGNVSSSAKETQPGNVHEGEQQAEQNLTEGRVEGGTVARAEAQSLENGSEEIPGSAPTSSERQTVLSGTEGEQDGATMRANNVSQNSAHTPREQVPVEEARSSPLENCKISLFEKTIAQYEMDTYSSSSVGSFDFVIAEPFQKVPESDLIHMDGKDISNFVQCVRRMLISGGFCMVILEWSKLQEWLSAFATSEMEIVCDPFLIMKDAAKFQKMNLRGLQNVYEPAIVARKTGRHPKDFKIDKRAPYVHLSSCRMPRWCNVVDGVPPAQGKLTFKPSRALVRPNERNPALIMELLQTFCPPQGRVLDPFAGALTTGLACISTHRECVLLETDSRCLSMALPRLEEFAHSKCSEEQAALPSLADSETPSNESSPLEESSMIGGREDERVRNQDSSTDQASALPHVSNEAEARSAKSLELPQNTSEICSGQGASMEEHLMSEVTRLDKDASSKTNNSERDTSARNVVMEENSPAPLQRKTRKRIELETLQSENLHSEAERPKRSRRQPARLVSENRKGPAPKNVGS